MRVIFLHKIKKSDVKCVKLANEEIILIDALMGLKTLTFGKRCQVEESNSCQSLGH